jgi:D-alanyl-lipoteichoic acid acyltransferase DltB (MBOAT superfamily)
VLFPTIEFCIFFCVVLPVSWALMPRLRAWKLFILAVSYAFYATASWRFCLLLAGVTLGNQLFARLIARAGSERRRSQLVGLAVGLDLLVLGVFKYYGFFVTQVADALDAFGLGMPLPLLSIALPVGVSFFTFQAISYVVDVRRRVLEPAATVDVALYLSFFSHLVAGPIVRAREFLPQILTPRSRHDVPVGPAVLLIVVGLVKKVVIADFLARKLVDPVFAVPEAYSSADALLAAYGYAAQIYCDFSGYTDMAIGLALLMGIRFPQNFDAPYRARSLREFWRRWHMTLSRFLRDFLYIPLGGNRGGRARQIRNVMITMLLGGLWHGAALGFIVWGALHGGYQAVEVALRDRLRWRIPGWLRWAVCFHLVVLAWIPFRAPSLDLAWAFFKRLGASGPATLWHPTVVLAVVVVIGLQLVPQEPIRTLRSVVEGLRPTVLAPAVAVAVLVVAATVPSGGVPPFIYFRF